MIESDVDVRVSTRGVFVPKKVVPAEGGGVGVKECCL